MVADFFRQALGTIISRQRTSAKNPSPAVWGEELLHQSLSTLWCPREWSDVDDDELVLFLPSLFPLMALVPNCPFVGRSSNVLVFQSAC